MRTFETDVNEKAANVHLTCLNREDTMKALGLMKSTEMEIRIKNEEIEEIKKKIIEVYKSGVALEYKILVGFQGNVDKTLKSKLIENAVCELRVRYPVST
jgi:hypothetical protein